ncbi:zinc-dependent metalloprotease [Corynebacterium sp. sy017]|uniref:zinc-dependent metalloprotease n=1 Tax=unclassified Corynebacterium TaxID=2624378 RepID=UPI001185092C|nr:MULTISPECIES: zinc-dependent metalloprotease [unclassified Corynebacterium]MBP3088761.1 zinc-dependent metalloprotease [Corynebacterium sp. sy017]TSD92042.1 zinc-dependent metalloprotease [Corynebacterium sp. SY003]
MNNGFGFSFSFNGNDDDDNNDKNNPFGGGLGDMLNQFGQMLSGMGSTMNSPDGQGPVNYALAERIARQQIHISRRITDSDVTAVNDAVRLAELWLDKSTILPASGNKVEVWNEENWLENTLPTWKRMVTPVAENMNAAQMESLPEEAREMVGPMIGMMNQMSGMNFGMQLGNALGDLADQTLTGTDFGLPIAPAGITALLPKNLGKISHGLGFAQHELLVYLAAQESARQRLFHHAPWLIERLVSSAEEYASGLVIDTSHIEEKMREMNLESGDPSAIQDAMHQLQEMDLSPNISSSNLGAVTRLETLLALIEGWVEYVVTEALSEMLPSTAAMNEAWKHRRETGGSAEKAFSSVVGIEFDAPKVAAAVELWRRVTVAVGAERRDQVWDHPDFLPTAEDLDNSAEFIDGLLDDALGNDFDPIAEITALEEQLAEQARQTEDAEDSSDDSDSDNGSVEGSDEGPDEDPEAKSN